MLGYVVAISPPKEVAFAVKEIGAEIGLNVSVMQCALDDAANVAKAALSGGGGRSAVVISHGATLQLLKQVFGPVPLVGMDTTEYDVVLALNEARKAGQGQIGILVGNADKLEVIQKASRLLDVPVQVYVCTNYNDLPVQVDNAQRDGIGVLVGGGERWACLAREKNIKCVPLLPSESTVRLALERAKDILETAYRVNENVERLKAILTYLHEGIMAIDENNRISVFNPVASRVFGYSENEVVGRTLDDPRCKRYFVDLFRSAEKKSPFVHQTRNTALLVNRVPLVLHGNCKGIVVTFKDVTRIQEGESKSRQVVLAKGLTAKFTFEDVVYVGSQMAALIAKAKKFANTDCTVLIRGETGTGKELIAQSIHNAHSQRRNRPFVAVNCASLDDSLLNSELFGYEGGSFTGASKGGKPGLFELAHRGTLFLDEIGKIKLEMQYNLLRVLQEKEVRRIGSGRMIPVDVRVIAATNENLEKLISENIFRKDLYYRLNVLSLIMPPLKMRRGDIPDLALSILKRFSLKHGKVIESLPLFVLRKLALYDWPGNVRQLEHLIERCVVLSEDEVSATRVMMELIEDEFGRQLPTSTQAHSSECEINVRLGTLRQMEAEIIQKLALTSKTNKTELALRLGISRPTLLKLLNDFR